MKFLFLVLFALSFAFQEINGEVKVSCKVKNIFEPKYAFMNNSEEHKIRDEARKAMNRTNTNVTLGSFYVFISQDVSNLHINVELSTAISKTEEGFKTYINQTFNVCSISKYRSRNFVYKVFFEDTEKYSNFKLKCPFKKGAYELYERPLKASQIPSFFTDIRFKVDLGFYTKKQLKYEMLFILKHDCIFKRVE